MKYISTRTLDNTNSGNRYLDNKNYNKNIIDNQFIPHDLVKLTTLLYNNIIIPLNKDQFDMVLKNEFIVHLVKKKLLKYDKNKYETYNELIHCIDTILGILYENESYTNNIFKAQDKLTYYVRTKPIRLLAEYELYNHIFGKPDNFNYDKDKLQSIKYDLNKENATYDTIKQHALQI